MYREESLGIQLSPASDLLNNLCQRIDQILAYFLWRSVVPELQKIIYYVKAITFTLFEKVSQEIEKEKEIWR